MKYKLIYEYSDLSQNPYITEDRDKKIAEKFIPSFNGANNLIKKLLLGDGHSKWNGITFNMSYNFAVEELTSIPELEPNNIIEVLGLEVSAQYQMWFCFCIKTNKGFMIYGAYCESHEWGPSMERMKPIMYDGKLADTEDILIEYILTDDETLY